MKESQLNPILIQDEMRQSYLDYAMSVIVGRALPDARDGLKPVHRRVLYAMHDQGNVYSKPYKKSARIVGDVIGKYHPHGDQAVYDTMVRMVQDFSLRHPLIDGQGNFGSIDGDNAAAMRYTEVRMNKVAAELLADLDKETVDFQPNYDESLQEPIVLPTRAPNLLMNGSSGIAVGMATNIPPHNLIELVKALIMLINDSNVSDEAIRAVLPGPDFPTGGFISGSQGLHDGYYNGRGIIKVRAKTHFEEIGQKDAIIVDELPYQVNKARLIEKIAELAGEKRLEGISDLRDESDRQGMRVVIELKRNEVREVVLNRLYKLTQLQTSFGINNVALVHEQPRVMGVRDMLTVFIDFRREVIVRRTRFELRKAEARAHILEGLVKALDHLDDIIEMIRKSSDPAEAKDGLISRFEFSAIQAQAILDMKLQRLTGLERDKITKEYEEIKIVIADLVDILSRPERVSEITVEELQEVSDAHGNPRRSVITADIGHFDIEDLIADDAMVVTISHNGYMKRTPTHVYDAQKRGGKGKIGMNTRDEDFVERMFVATAHNYLLCFTDKGRVHWLKVHQIPQAGRGARGLPIVNLLELQEKDESVTTILPITEFSEDLYVMMATRAGVVKRTPLMKFARPRSSGIIAVDLDDGDRLVKVAVTDGSSRILIGTRNGQAVLFDEKDVRVMGRTARGVRGIRLGDGDYVIGAEVCAEPRDILTVSAMGYGKRTSVEDYRQTKRGSKGVKTMAVSDKTGLVAGVRQVEDGDEIMMIADSGKLIRFKAEELRTMGRSTQGVRLLNLVKAETVVSVAVIPAELVSAEDDEFEPESVDGSVSVVAEAADGADGADAGTDADGESDEDGGVEE